MALIYVLSALNTQISRTEKNKKNINRELSGYTLTPVIFSK